MTTRELFCNRSNECAECGTKLRPLRLLRTNLCIDCEKLLADLARVEAERKPTALNLTLERVRRESRS